MTRKQPDDVSVSLDLMDERWPGYSTAKHIIRSEIEALRHTTEVCCKQWAGEAEKFKRQRDDYREGARVEAREGDLARKDNARLATAIRQAYAHIANYHHGKAKAVLFDTGLIGKGRS